MTTVGENIRYERKKQRFSQEGLSELTGLSRNSIINWETEKRSPTVRDLEIIAKSLGVPVTALICGGDFASPVEETAEKPKRRSLASIDFETIVRALVHKNPDIVDLFHSVQERLDGYSDRELQAIADGLSFVFGKMSI